MLLVSILSLERLCLFWKVAVCHCKLILDYFLRLLDMNCLMFILHRFLAVFLVDESFSFGSVLKFRKSVQLFFPDHLFLLRFPRSIFFSN